MNAELRYFSGTGNSFKILDTCRSIFEENGCETKIASITAKSVLNDTAELIGFCFPVYAFGIPRICRNYLKALPRFARGVNCFVLITAGDREEAGFAVQESCSLLNGKGLNVVYSDVVHMPANWTVSMNPPAKDEARAIIDKGVEKVSRIAGEILKGTSYHHTFNYPSSYSKLRFYKDYYLFKWFGVSQLWRNFQTDATCDGCSLCEQLCPTDSIRMVGSTPTWQKSCEQCMRCVNFCPKRAIFQKGEGSVKERNIYREPSFKPLKIE